MDERLFYSGPERKIEWAVMRDGKIPALREWEKLEGKKKAHLAKTIEMLGDQPKVRNTNRFKHERDQIFAIRTPRSFKVRVYCFFTRDQRIVLTNIDLAKKQDKADPQQLERATRIRDECING